LCPRQGSMAVVRRSDDDFGMTSHGEDTSPAPGSGRWVGGDTLDFRWVVDTCLDVGCRQMGMRLSRGGVIPPSGFRVGAVKIRDGPMAPSPAAPPAPSGHPAAASPPPFCPRGEGGGVGSIGATGDRRWPRPRGNAAAGWEGRVPCAVCRGGGVRSKWVGVVRAFGDEESPPMPTSCPKGTITARILRRLCSNPPS